MFLRRNRWVMDRETYEYWTFVRTVRTAKGPRQEVVASLGKLPGLDHQARGCWEDIANSLEGRSGVPEQGELGKRLDFLIQELHREANTLGSKSSALELTNISVEMKVAIEQMREQVQNIE